MRTTGTVKWFNDAKGYGFIAPEDGSKDVFVHFSGIRQRNRERRTLEDNARVEFTIEQGDNGKPQAVDVITIG